MSSVTKRIVVVGAGVSGLTAAYRIQKAMEQGGDVQVTVVERDSRVGGKLWTERATDDLGRTIVAEGGSDSFLAVKPGVHRIAAELGIADQVVGTMDENKGTYIVKSGRMLPLVDGMMMFAPTKIVPLATSKLYSWPGKLRMGLDLIIPKKVQPASGIEDESLESLVVRRLGRECLDRVAEPLVGGVNGSDPATMSIMATYPMLLEMEQKHGSLILGFLAQRKAVKGAAGQKGSGAGPGASGSGGAPQGAGSTGAPTAKRPRSMFASFGNGLGFFTDTLAERVGSDNIRLATEVVSIVRSGGGYDVTVRPTGSDSAAVETIHADGVVLAVEAWAAGTLLAAIDTRAAEIASSIPNSSCATITMEFDESVMPFHRKWHGALSPGVERRPVTGISLVSSKWAKRTPEGAIQLRCFVGGARDANILDHSDDELVAFARQSYKELLGIPLEATSRYTGVFRFEKGMPQYTVGHLDRMDELDEIVARVPGFEVAGGAFRGVGVPNCVDSGDFAAQRILVDLGVEITDGGGAGGR